MCRYMEPDRVPKPQTVLNRRSRMRLLPSFKPPGATGTSTSRLVRNGPGIPSFANLQTFHHNMSPRRDTWPHPTLIFTGIYCYTQQHIKDLRMLVDLSQRDCLSCSYPRRSRSCRGLCFCSSETKGLAMGNLLDCLGHAAGSSLS